MEIKKEITAYLENISLIILAILLFAFPLVVTPLTTDAFTLPKQILSSTTVIILFLFLGVRMISEGSVRIRRTPFDIPLIIFAVVIFISSLFSINRADAFIAYFPFLFSILLYFLIVNFAKTKSSFLMLLGALVGGACVSAIITILSFFQIYLLPFTFTKVNTFTPFGSLLDQLIYLVLILPIALYHALPIITSLPAMLAESEKEETATNGEKNVLADALTTTIGFSVASIVIIAGIGVIIYQVVFAKQQVPLLILPFEVGFQTAFAAVSQDANRVAQGFFFGSGFGTYITDFSKFKQAVPFNLNQTLWSLPFFRSSSFVLELLATTGVLGLAAFIYLISKIIQRIKLRYTQSNPLFFSLIFAIIAAFFLPLSPVIQTVLFFILGIFAVAEGLNPKASFQFFDVEFYFLGIRKANHPASEHVSSIGIQDKSVTILLPIILFGIFVIFDVVFGFLSYRFVASDILFQDSLIAAAANDGLKTYNDETNAINTFPYRDSYYRIYSQTNLAIANSLAAQLTNGASPSAQTQKTIIDLIQQSINTARNATIISPATSLNWQNLSSIYRSLIGFGQGAEEFAVASAQQAITLDPNNPQEYLNLGGIYYQLQRWDLAQQEFQRAINLKPDFANAYYNLGHTLENKNDLQNALLYYQTVKTLVANNPTDLQRITAEIDTLQQKLGQQQAAQTQPATQTVANQPPLKINTPPAQLPERKPPVEIPPLATPSAQ